MKEFLKKGLLVGMGAAEFTRETLARAVAELEKKGEVSKTEARKIMESFSKSARKRRKELEATMEKGMAAVLARMHLATSGKVEEMEKRIRALERKLKAKK